MKRKLHFLMIFLLMIGGVSQSWADNTVKYSTDGGSSWTEAADLNALSSVFKDATTDIQVQLLDNQTLTGRVTWSEAYTLTIVPTKDITIKGPAGAMWFLANVDNAKIVMGNNTCKITLDGENKSHTSGDITRRENNGSVSLTNITFKDFKLNSATHLCSSRDQGNSDGLILENITIENCTNPETAYIYSDRVVNDVIKLKGYLNVDENSTGTTIRTKLETKYNSGTSTYTTTGRIKVDDSAGALTATKTITVTFTEKSTTYVPQIGAAIIINSTNNFTDETAAVFALANDVAYGTFRSNKDLKLTQAYNLSVTAAGAATLVLPFASKIPSGATAYTLTHTSGAQVVSATEVTGGTLAANTPVYVETNEGSYKFVSTATTGALATGSDPVAYGALTGVYSDLTFTTENIASTYANTYILNKINENVGFYKADDGLKVGANRCYLTATNVPGENAARGLEIVFDDEEVSSISEELRVKSEESAPTAEYFDLQGRKVAQPTKGLYIVNGKKVVIK